MGREEEMLKERLRKIEELRKAKINPYPYSYEVTHRSAELLKKYSHLKNEEKTKDKVKVAGRVMTIRSFGKLSFVQLQDSEGKIQIFIEENSLGKKENEFFLKHVDSGDFIGIEGVMHRTKRGEISVLAQKIEILSKGILPLPEKWHGLTDKEERYRQRYVDLMMNPEVKDVFVKRSQIINAIREFLNSKKFVEVDTPILQPIYGGAAARPFISHLNELKMTVYMRISNELYLKRLLVGGFERVYEFARDFRNEGIDRTHNPEFTQVEMYQAYADYEDMMKLFEETYEYVAKKVLGKTEIDYQGHRINLKAPWQRLSMKDAIKKFGEIDVDKKKDKELKEIIKKNNIEVKGESRGMLIAAIFEHFCEKNLIQPTFIYDYPEETTPLCKEKRGMPGWVERFEPYIASMEIGNAYSELNDPIKQRKLLEGQAAELKKGNEEANPLDEDFIRSIEYGMPPTGGIGMAIDRMVMILTNSSSIRDVILFPFMKPEVETKEEKIIEKVEKQMEKKEKPKKEPKLKNAKKSKK